jgi:hypothetical protein
MTYAVFSPLRVHHIELVARPRPSALTTTPLSAVYSSLSSLRQYSGTEHELLIVSSLAAWSDF